MTELINGDCLEEMKNIKDKSIDMILCDLPYGITNCNWDSIIPLNKHVYIGDKFLYEDEFIIKKCKEGLKYEEAINIFNIESKCGIWQHYERIIKDNGVILLFGQSPFDKVLGESNLKLLRYEWIWEKTQATGHLNAKKMPMKAHENILVFYKKLPTYNPQKTTGHKPTNNYTKYIDTQNNTDIYNTMSKEIKGGGETDRYPRSVLKFKSDKQKSKLHPTQKPVKLLKYLIETYTNKNDLVLDNTAGSFSTGIACIKTNRNFIGIELDKNYFEIGKKRIELEQQKLNLF